jgi:uncharacterized protein
MIANGIPVEESVRVNDTLIMDGDIGTSFMRKVGHHDRFVERPGVADSRESLMPARRKSGVIGVISDTHGLLRPEVTDAFRGVSLILHAGDIGCPEILDGLRGIAPVIAVRGNNDTGAWAKRIPEVETVKVGSVSIHVVHDVKTMREHATKFDVVISGHSHRPLVETREGVLYLNPGSAGPRRFRLPICVARLFVESSSARAELVLLE